MGEKGTMAKNASNLTKVEFLGENDLLHGSTMNN